MAEKRAEMISTVPSSIPPAYSMITIPEHIETTSSTTQPVSRKQRWDLWRKKHSYGFRFFFLTLFLVLIVVGCSFGAYSRRTNSDIY